MKKKLWTVPFSVDFFLDGRIALAKTNEALLSKSLKAIRLALSEFVTGLDWVVIGKGESNESVRSEIGDQSSKFRLISVNGSTLPEEISSQRAVLFLTSSFLRVGDANSARTRTLVRHRDYELLVFVGSRFSFWIARFVLYALRVRYRRSLSMTRIQRAAVIRQVLAEDLGLGVAEKRISSGLFCVVLGFWAGANAVSYYGFTLTNRHACPDKKALDILYSTNN